jgi:hypothetical protein
MLALVTLFAFLSAVGAFQTAAPMARSRGVATMMADKSQSLPFLPQPPNLVGLTAGNVGKNIDILIQYSSSNS